MATLTLRLPDNLDRQLNVLAAQTHQRRSELVRTALEKFLRDQEREQLLAEMVAAARFMTNDPQARAESIAIAEEFEAVGSEAPDSAEGGKADEPAPEQWWK